MSHTLHVGIHRGSMTSRDAEQPKQFETLEAARTAAHEAFKWYDSMGISCWYCYAIDDKNGERTDLIEGVDYDSKAPWRPARKIKPTVFDPFEL